MESEIQNPKSEIGNRGPGLRFDLGPEHPEEEIHRVIAQHVGADQAITIAGVAQEIWPNEWWFVRGESHGFPVYPYRQRIERAIKAAVRRMRRTDVKIGAERGRVPGYYIIQTPQELAMTVAPLLRQALDELKTIEALTGREYYVRELAGQMKLFQKSSSEEREVRGEKREGRKRRSSSF